jgi:AcrR family transcriptional regulator
VGHDTQWLNQPTRRRILDACEERFAAIGYDAARVEDIAAAAKVSKSHLYYHFPSKQDLLSSLVQLRTGEILADKGRIFPPDMGGAFADEAALARLLKRAFVELLLPQRRFIRIVLVEAIRNPVAAQPVFAALGAVLDDTLARFRSAGISLDEPRAKSLLFHFGILPSLYLVALDADPTGFPDGPTALASDLAAVELALVRHLGEGS